MKLIARTFDKVIGFKLTQPLFLLSALIMLSSHDLYIKMETYFLKPNQETTLSLYNGTFESSENSITRNRILDASIVSHGNRQTIDSSKWKDQDSTITQLSFTAGNAGTYVVGVSTKANTLAQSAFDFNVYLKHDGVLDMLSHRFDNALLDQDVVESYQKHVKAIYQVGEVKTDDWNTVLGYPIEFIPMESPYKKHTGETIDIRLLVDGKPVINQLVYANHKGIAHTHDGGEAHSHTHGQKLRTNEQGIVTVTLDEDGIYYLRTIHMVEVNNAEVTHKSKWATLSFEVTNEHGTHNSHHHKEEGIPTSGFIVVSIAIIGLLFIYFKYKG
ncbi:DUF4198 domain-containing protein [Flammeovirga kamogawensis]|uniref:DUF4198 domain-containing protein n=1 Tax=Flammeovirga kamogawensis TaxID=373891 RepID=A0ABX8H1N6_9BACT|nr:DUF4198 domain-containing protein [Flammeovirga kamogawensis]MBB6463261.1 hypothetical protein [Flammeovirga kamogawensis]QWG09589.1 DUF4198 domain-containing protein [Flammeovirga kamogawensis]